MADLPNLLNYTRTRSVEEVTRICTRHSPRGRALRVRDQGLVPRGPQVVVSQWSHAATNAALRRKRPLTRALAGWYGWLEAACFAAGSASASRSLRRRSIVTIAQRSAVTRGAEEVETLPPSPALPRADSG